MGKGQKMLNINDKKQIKVNKVWTFSDKDRNDLIRVLGEDKTNDIEQERTKKYIWISSKFDINIGTQESKENQKRRDTIIRSLNREYYNKDSAWFDNIWVNNFYDEWNIVFANFTWKSKIFNFDGVKLIDTWKTPYRTLEKVWDFYEWIQATTSNVNGNIYKNEWSEIYSVLNKQWVKIKSLNWPLSLTKWVEDLYIEKYIKNRKSVTTIYDKDLNILGKNIPEWFKFLFRSNWEILFKNTQLDVFWEDFVILSEWENRKNHEFSDYSLKDSKVYIDYQKYLNNQKNNK